jgi:hypothetical protein
MCAAPRPRRANDSNFNRSRSRQYSATVTSLFPVNHLSSSFHVSIRGVLVPWSAFGPTLRLSTVRASRERLRCTERSSGTFPSLSGVMTRVTPIATARPIISDTARRFLRCGDLHFGSQAGRRHRRGTAVGPQGSSQDLCDILRRARARVVGRNSWSLRGRRHLSSLRPPRSAGLQGQHDDPATIRLLRIGQRFRRPMLIHAVGTSQRF